MEINLDKQFDEMTLALAKDGQDIINDLTPEKADLLHMAVGVSGEAGELLDAVKKAVIYNKEMDLENIIEELGDLEFYMSKIRQIVGVTREEILQRNIDKLEAFVMLKVNTVMIRHRNVLTRKV